MAVLFPGSGGLIQLRNEERPDPNLASGNFLVRSRAEFVKRGVVAAILDAPSDQQGGWGMSDEFRLGDASLHGHLGRGRRALDKRFPGVPVFLIGTSRGNDFRGGVGRPVRSTDRRRWCLTSTMFRAAPRQVQGAGAGIEQASILRRSRFPSLFVHHVSDQCEFTPYSDAARLSDKYPLITVFGGAPPQSGPCDAFSAHGYFGKESETVEQIVNWMLKKPFLHEVK